MSGLARIKLPAGTSLGAMAFSATDPGLLAVAVGGKVFVYDILNSATPVTTVQYLDGTTPISSIAFSQDGNKLAVGASKSVQSNGDWTAGMVWDISIDAGKHTLTVNGAGVPLISNIRDPITQLTISKDVSIAGTGYTVTTMNAIGVQTLFSAGAGAYQTVATTDPTPIGQFTWQPTAIDLSEYNADGMAAWLAAGYAKGYVIMDSRSGKGGIANTLGTARYLTGDIAKVLAVGFDEETNNLVVVADVNGISVLGINRKTNPVSLKKTVGLVKNAGGVVSAAVSTNGNYVFLGFKDGSVHVYWGVVPPAQAEAKVEAGDPVTVEGAPIILHS